MIYSFKDSNASSQLESHICIPRYFFVKFLNCAATPENSKINRRSNSINPIKLFELVNVSGLARTGDIRFSGIHSNDVFPDCYS